MNSLERTERELPINDMDALVQLFGNLDENVRVIQEETGTSVIARGSSVYITGEPERVEMAYEVMSRLLGLIRRHEPLDKNRIRYAVSLAAEGQAEMIDEMMNDTVAITYRGKPVRCKTMGQSKYVRAIRRNTLVFALGPAGTGKTYLAMAMAVAALKNKEITRIVLTRPVVEAGEKLGFLPGDLQHKVDPYLRPLYDAFYELMGQESYQKLMERGVIEVAPLAYMRGRTLSDSFIILDEAQNTTSEQMKMFLTRFGEGSRVVVTGDNTQTDLPAGKKSGLKEAVEVLRNVPDIAIVTLSHRDVVRHELVQAIVKAYERHDQGKR